MSEEQLPKEGQAQEQAAEVKPGEQPQQQTISVQDILNTYPIDRDKCRDVLMIEISGNLRRIANSLEGISQALIVANTHLSDLKNK
jgi:hypothetical protein